MKDSIKILGVFLFSLILLGAGCLGDSDGGVTEIEVGDDVSMDDFAPTEPSLVIEDDSKVGDIEDLADAMKEDEDGNTDGTSEPTEFPEERELDPAVQSAMDRLEGLLSGVVLADANLVFDPDDVGALDAVAYKSKDGNIFAQVFFFEEAISYSEGVEKVESLEDGLHQKYFHSTNSTMLMYAYTDEKDESVHEELERVVDAFLGGE